MKLSRLIVSAYAVCVVAGFCSTEVASAKAKKPANRAPTAPSTCRPTGPQNIAVIVADYEGAPSKTPPADINYVRELFEGSDGGVSIKDFFSMVSEKRVSLAHIRYFGPYHYPSAPQWNPTEKRSVDSVMDQFERDLMGVADREADMTKFDRVVFFTPPPLNAQTGGEAPLATGSAAMTCDLYFKGARGEKHYGHAWLRSSYFRGYTGAQLSTQWDRLTNEEKLLKIRDRKIDDMGHVVHEMGHTFGLGHSNRVNRPSVVVKVNTHDEVLPDEKTFLYPLVYGDYFTPMSSSAMGWFSVPHLVSLGWIDKKAVKEVRSNGRFRLYPVEIGGKKLRGLKIPRQKHSGDKTNATLWVEYRRPATPYELGPISRLLKFDGPQVRYTNPDQPMDNGWRWPNETMLLDFAPPGTIEAAMPVDYILRTDWKDAHSRVHITTENVTNEYVDVRVTFD